MTRKDYQLIASVINQEYKSIEYTYNDTMTAKAIMLELVVAMADRLKSDNDRFQRQKFYTACVGQDLA